MPEFLWIGFAVEWETLAEMGWEVGGTSFLVGGAGFVKAGRAVFWVGRGLLTGVIEGERADEKGVAG